MFILSFEMINKKYLKKDCNEFGGGEGGINNRPGFFA